MAVLQSFWVSCSPCQYYPAPAATTSLGLCGGREDGFCKEAAGRTADIPKKTPLQVASVQVF